MQVTDGLLDIARDKKNIEKRKREKKNEKKSNSNKYFFTFTLL